MSTSHNRFYSERIFVKYLNNIEDENILKRLAIEIKIENPKSIEALEHLMKSIPISLNAFPEIIKKTYKEIKK
jgi:hypothetical protein